MDKKDVIAITLLFLVSFIIWTLPLKGQKYPFGEGDAAHQFGIADWMAISDKAQREYPLHIAVWYGHINKENYFAPVYAPPYFIDLAIFQVIGTDRFLPKGIFIAIISVFLSVASTYFIARKLFGFFPAITSSFLIIFELRLVMSYIWGQRPILASLGIIPMVFYCYYRYITLSNEGKEKPIYLIFMAIFIAISGMFYPLSIGFEAIVLILYSLFIILKYKKFPFNIKNVIISVLVFSVLFSPFFMDYKNQNALPFNGLKIQNLSSLFKWFDPGPNPDNAVLYSYKAVNGGYWTIPLLIIGIIFLSLKRTDQNILLLSWLIGLYILLHITVLGFDIGKLTRIYKATSHIFYIIISVGLITLASLFRSSKNIRILVKYSLVSGFLIMAIIFNARPIYSTLKGTYPPMLRMTDAQYNAAEWMRAELPADSVIYPLGTLTYPKYRWMHMLSHRAFNGVLLDWEKANDWLKEQPIDMRFTHILFDYSDLIAIRNQGQINSLQIYEQQISNNNTLLYNQDNIRIYKYGN